MIDENTRPFERKLLTKKELASYREWLAELDAEARKSGGDLTNCDEDLWRIFSPRCWIGKQVCASFSDEDLLDIALRSMDQKGHKVETDNIYCIYLEYIKCRMGLGRKMMDRVRARRKNLRNEQRYPLDWPEHITIKPLLKQYLKNPLTEADIALLEDIRRRAQASRMIPELTPEEKNQLDKFGGAGQAMKMMGIPIIRGSELRHMKQYWETERAKQAAEAAGKNAEEQKCTK